VRREDVDVVIELIGGIEPALSLLLAAIETGKSVVTANKALLAQHGAEVFEAAAEADVDVYYEAAVAGAIPIIRPLRESLVGDAITASWASSTAPPTTSSTRCTPTARRSPTRWPRPRRWATPRPTPTADVEGHDAAAKAAILASLAFHTRVTARRRGLRGHHR
jgi:homoserine dehydrogenase